MPPFNNNKITIFLSLTIISLSFRTIFPESHNIITFNLSDLLHGFVISTSSPTDKPNFLGFFNPNNNQSLTPNTWEWRLAQWGTRLPLSISDFKIIDKSNWFAENEVKKIEFYTIENVPHLKLFCKGTSEFNGKLRKYGEPWPHLLIEHKFPRTIKTFNSEINFEIKFRITNCTEDPNLASKIDSSLHTAQITAYWTIANKNQSSKDYDDYFWFGIPLFDYRYPIPPKHFDKDKGAPSTTNKLIYVVEGKTLWDKPTGDKKEKHLTVSLSPLINNAIRDIKDKGFFTNSNASDFYITSFNLGWEITGPFDAEIEISRLNFTAKVIGDTK